MAYHIDPREISSFYGIQCHPEGALIKYYCIFYNHVSPMGLCFRTPISGFMGHIIMGMLYFWFGVIRTN